MQAGRLHHGANQSTYCDAALSGALCGSPIGTTGVLNKVGTGTLTLTNMNTAYTSVPAVISAGVLQLGDGTTNGSIAGNIADNASLVFNNGSDQTFSNVITGSGTVTKNRPGHPQLCHHLVRSDRPGDQFLCGRNGYFRRYSERRRRRLARGRSRYRRDEHHVQRQRDAAMGRTPLPSTPIARSVSPAVRPPASTSPRRYCADNTYIAGSATIAAAISGAGNLLKTDGGTLLLTGTNTYAGTTTVNAGTLQAATAARCPVTTRRGTS